MEDLISQIRLVILNSIWFPFHTFPGLKPSMRAPLLARVNQVLARLCSSLGISVLPQLRLPVFSPTYTT